MRITSGSDYEKWCALWLQKHGYKNVRMTKASRDQGIDILCEKNNYRYGIQCKYYSSPVGNFSVQEAYTGAAFYQCDQAVVMTNSTFTKDAEDAAEETNVELWDHFSPSAASVFARIFDGLLLLRLVLCVCLFIYVALHAELDHRTFLTVLSLVSACASLASIFSTSFSPFLSLFLEGMCLCMLILFTAYFPAFSFVFYAELLLAFISLFVFLRDKHQHRLLHKEEDLLLKAEDENEARYQKAMEIKEVLARELHCEITLVSYVYHEEKKLLTMQYHTNANVEADLPLAQYALQQNEKENEIILSDLNKRRIQADLWEKNV